MNYDNPSDPGIELTSTPIMGTVHMMPFAGSPELGELFKALATAQGQLEHPRKDRTVRTEKYSYTYADLASVLTACKPLHAVGLAVAQFVAVEGKRVSVTTVLGHVSGQWIASTISCDAQTTASQQIGTAETYLRRYGLSALVGLASEDDTDDAPGPKPKHTPPRRAPAKPAKPAPAPPESDGTLPLARATDGITPEQTHELAGLAKEYKATGGDPAALCKQLTGVAKSSDLSEEQAATAVTGFRVELYGDGEPEPGSAG